MTKLEQLKLWIEIPDDNIAKMSKESARALIAVAEAAAKGEGDCNCLLSDCSCFADGINKALVPLLEEI